MRDMSRKPHLSSSETPGAATKPMIVNDDDVSTSSRLLDYSVQRANTQAEALESSFGSICSKDGLHDSLQNFVVNVEEKDKSDKMIRNSGVNEGKGKRNRRISYHDNIPGLNVAFHNNNVPDLRSMNISNHSDIRSKGRAVNNNENVSASANKRGSGSSLGSQSSTKSQQQLLDDAVSATEYLLSLPLDGTDAYHAGRAGANLGAPSSTTKVNNEKNEKKTQGTNSNKTGKDAIYTKTRVDTSMESPIQRPGHARKYRNQKQSLSPLQRTTQKPLSRVKRQTSNGSTCSKGSLGSLLDISDRSRSKSPISMSGMSASSISLRFNLDDSDSDESDSSTSENKKDSKDQAQEEAQIPKGSCSSRLQKSFSNLILSANAKAASSQSNKDSRRRTRSVSPKRPEPRQQQFRQYQMNSQSSSKPFGGDEDESDDSADDDDDLWGATTNIQKHEPNIDELLKIAKSKIGAKNAMAKASLSAHTQKPTSGASDLASPGDCINFSIRRTRSVGGNIQNILAKGACSAGDNQNVGNAELSSTDRLRRSLSNVMQIAVLSEGAPGVDIVEDKTEINKPKQTVKRTRSAGSVPLGIGLGGAPAVRISRRSRLKINRQKETNMEKNGNALANFQPAATANLGRSSTDGKISRIMSNTLPITSGSSKKNSSRNFCFIPQCSKDAGGTPVLAPPSASPSSNRGISRQLNSAMSMSTSSGCLNSLAPQQHQESSKRHGDAQQEQIPATVQSTRCVTSTGGSHQLSGGRVEKGNGADVMKESGKRLHQHQGGAKGDTRVTRSPSVSSENGLSIPMRRSNSSASVGMGKKKLVSTGNLFSDRRNTRRNEQQTPVKNAQWEAQSRLPLLKRTMSSSDSQSKLAALAAMSRTENEGTVEPHQNTEVGARSQMPALKRTMSRSDSQSKLAMLASMSRAKSQGTTGAQKNAHWGTQPQVPALKRTLSKSDSVSKMAMLAALSREKASGTSVAGHSRTSLKQRTASVDNLLAEGRMPAIRVDKLSSLMAGMKQSKSQAMMPGLDRMMSGLEGPESPSGEGKNASWASTRQANKSSGPKSSNQRVNPFVAAVEAAQGMVNPSIGSSPRPSTPRSSEEHERVSRPIPIHKRAMPRIETSFISETSGPMPSSRRSLIAQTSLRGSSSAVNMSSSRRSVSRTSSGHRRLFLDSSGQRIGPPAASDNNDALSRLNQLMDSSLATREKTLDTTPTSRRVSRTTSHKSSILSRLERLSGDHAGVADRVPPRRTSSSKRLTGNKGSQANLLNDTSHFVTGSRIRRFNSTNKLSN